MTSPRNKKDDKETQKKKDSKATAVTPPAGHANNPHRFQNPNPSGITEAHPQLTTVRKPGIGQKANPKPK